MKNEITAEHRITLERLQNALTQWKCFDMKPCMITIGKQVYLAMLYSQVCKGLNDSKPYINTAFYVLGSLPKSYKHGSMWSDGTVYTDRQTGVSYYIAGYADDNAIAKYPSAHPMGIWFGLSAHVGSPLNPKGYANIEITYL